MSEYRLSWTSFKNNLCNGFSQLQQKEEFVDMTLAADGHLVKVHRNVMSVASPYIKEMLQSTTCRDPVVFLNNVSSHVLSYILEYIYTGEVRVPKHTLSTFIKAAKSLHITGIKDLVAPMIPQELNQPSLENLSQRWRRLAQTGVEQNSYMQSCAVKNVNVNTEEHEENQPVVDDGNTYKFEDLNPQSHFESTNAVSNENNINDIDTDHMDVVDMTLPQTDPQRHCESTNAVSNENNINDVDTDHMDVVDMTIPQTTKEYPQISNIQTVQEKSLLDKAMENIEILDANEANKNVQYNANIILNFEDDGGVRLQNDKESAPKFNIQIQSCQRDSDAEYPALSISFNENTQRPETAPDSTTKVNTHGETHDASAPLYSISDRQCLQLILNRFIYNIHHSSHGNTKRRWRCSDYRKLNCKAYIDTHCGEIVDRKNEHTHGFHDAKILKKGSRQNIYSSIQEVEAAATEKKIL